jgi:hypothetical protein
MLMTVSHSPRNSGVPEGCGFSYVAGDVVSALSNGNECLLHPMWFSVGRVDDLGWSFEN